MSEPHATFGEFVEGVAYIPRPGGYAVIINDQGRIATVITPKGRFLPGGAIEQDETAEQAAVRETFEETGLHIRIIKSLGRSDELVYKLSAGKYFRKECEFYLADVVSFDGDGESDHILEWISAADAPQTLTHGSQAWVVDQVR